MGEPVSVAVATGVSKGSCSWEPCQLTALVDVISVEFFHLLRRSVVPFGPLVVFFVSGVLLKMFRMCNKRCRTGNSFYVQVTVYRALCRSARATSCFTSRAQLALNHVGYFSPWHSFAVNRSWCTVLLCVAVCPGLCLMFYLCVACWVRASRRVTREMCSHSHRQAPFGWVPQDISLHTITSNTPMTTMLWFLLVYPCVAIACNNRKSRRARTKTNLSRIQQPVHNRHNSSISALHVSRARTQRVTHAVQHLLGGVLVQPLRKLPRGDVGALVGHLYMHGEPRKEV